MFRRMDSELRIAMLQAVEERRELDHELLGPDHFLLGLLSNVRGSAYKVLAEQGVTYEWARRVVVEKHDDTASSAPARDRQDAADNLEEDREALRAIGIDLDKVRDAVRETFGEDITDGWGQRRGRGRHGGHRGRRPRGPHPRGGQLPCVEDTGEAGSEREGHENESEGFDEGFGPFGPGGFGPGGFGPGGRGRRGPRSRRFTQVTPSMHRVLHEMRQEMRASHGSGPWDDAGGPLAGVVLAALFNSGDPAIEAIIEASDDPKALRDAVDELADRTTA